MIKEILSTAVLVHLIITQIDFLWKAAVAKEAIA